MCVKAMTYKDQVAEVELLVCSHPFQALQKIVCALLNAETLLLLHRPKRLTALPALLQAAARSHAAKKKKQKKKGSSAAKVCMSES